MTAAEIRALTTAEIKAWRAARRSGLGLDCPAWQAAADALRMATKDEDYELASRQRAAFA